MAAACAYVKGVMTRGVALRDVATVLYRAAAFKGEAG